jgi:preprotein translocase subunit SecF
MDILGKRYWFFAVSLILIVPGFIIILVYGLPISIDFTGGTLLEIQFDSGQAPMPSSIVLTLENLGITDVQVQTTGDAQVIIRTPFLDDTTRAGIVGELEDRYQDTVTVLRFDSVGPTIGAEVTRRAALAVAVASILVVLYILYSFRSVPNALRYGVCAVLAMLHDVAIIFSLVAIGSRLFGWQVDALFLTAVLTVIGFSMQDTIVVFDRVRENSTIYRRLPFETLVNHSIVQTLQRSINTQLMTVEFMLLALLLFGGVTLRQFSFVLLIGLISGTYSSIFISAPVLVVWENHEWRRWFHRSKEATA